MNEDRPVLPAMYIDYVDILLGVPPLGVYNRNTVSERKWRFSSFMRQYLGNGTRYVQSYY